MTLRNQDIPLQTIQRRKYFVFLCGLKNHFNALVCEASPRLGSTGRSGIFPFHLLSTCPFPVVPAAASSPSLKLSLPAPSLHSDSSSRDKLIASN